MKAKFTKWGGIAIIERLMLGRVLTITLELSDCKVPIKWSAKQGLETVNAVYGPLLFYRSFLDEERKAGR